MDIQHDRGKDKPGHEIDTEGVVQLRSHCRVGESGEDTTARPVDELNHHNWSITPAQIR